MWNNFFFGNKFIQILYDLYIIYCVFLSIFSVIRRIKYKFRNYNNFSLLNLMLEFMKISYKMNTRTFILISEI